jgi:hypothetical protein
MTGGAGDGAVTPAAGAGLGARCREVTPWVEVRRINRLVAALPAVRCIHRTAPSDERLEDNTVSFDPASGFAGLADFEVLMPLVAWRRSSRRPTEIGPLPSVIAKLS